MVLKRPLIDYDYGLLDVYCFILISTRSASLTFSALAIATRFFSEGFLSPQ